MTKPFDILKTPLEGGTTLVEASAGTGKTYTLEAVFLRLLAEGRAPDASRILVVTFTIDATEELRTRIRRRLREAVDVFEGRARGDDFLTALAGRTGAEGRARIAAALAGFDEASIFTIHGFCRRVLEACAFESGAPFRPAFLEDDTGLLELAAADFFRARVVSDPLLAAVAVALGWDPETLLRDARMRRKRPGTVLLPPPEPLNAARDRFGRALHAVRKAWDRDAVETLLAGEGLRWAVKSPLHEDGRDAVLDAMDRFDGGDVAAAPTLVDPWTPAAVREGLHKACRDKAPDHPVFRACEKAVKARDALAHAFRAAFAEEVEARFEGLKREREGLDFDDLLRLTRDALTDPGRGPELVRALRDRWRAALVDEFQDTDPVQCDIFRTAFGSTTLYTIGDPKQAIYGFRGADVFAYMAARRDADRAYTLGRNYRSAGALVEAVNALFGGAPDPFLYAEIPFAPVDAEGSADQAPLAGDGRKPFQLWFLPPKRDGKGKELPWSKEAGTAVLVEHTAAEIVRLLEGGLAIGDRPLTPGDMAVLVRTNAQAAAVREALRAAGVPAILGDGGDIVETPQMEELLRVLEAVRSPRDGPAVRGALVTALWGFSADAVKALQSDDAPWNALVDRLEADRDAWRRRGFVPMALGWIAREGVRSRLLAGPDGHRALTNLLHAVEFLHRAAVENDLTPEGLLSWAARQRSAGARESDRAELRLETDEEAVQIATIHKSKGLEYEVVFCPFLWESRPHSEENPALAHLPDGRLVLDFGSSDKAAHDALADEERLAEEMRLTYVALTRAKRRCIAAWGVIGKVGGGAHGAALRYLLHPAGRNPAQARRAWKAEGAPVAARGGKGDPFARDFATWEEALRARVAACGDAMELTVLDDAPAPRIWTPRADEPRDCRARTFRARDPARLEPWRVASFSTLAHGAAREAPDHLDPPAPPDPAAAAPRGIFAFARGARAGTCLHEIFERCDFERAGEADAGVVVRDALVRWGFDDPEAHAGPLAPAADVLAMVRRVLAAPLPGVGVALSAVAGPRRLTEWNFTLPMGALVPAALSAVFGGAGAGAAAKAYAPRARALGAESLRGFLTGFVDLVFEHDGRWYLLDWKSNHLGNAPSDYGADALAEAMGVNHYVLQYHLYTLALHRFLAWRVPGYAYESHFGGAFYAFLRGIEAAGDNGWFFDRPSPALIRALDEAVAGGGR